MAKKKPVKASNGNGKPKDREHVRGVPPHLHVDMERTITALDLAIVKQAERIDRLVNATLTSKTVKGI